MSGQFERRRRRFTLLLSVVVLALVPLTLPALAVPGAARSVGASPAGAQDTPIEVPSETVRVSMTDIEPFVVDEGWDDSIAGHLFDTGLGYPAALLDDRTEPGGTIIGRTYALLTESLDRCLVVLDAEEDTVGGRYRRIVTNTSRGTSAYVYEYGSGLDLIPIDSGDWFAR